MSSGESTASSNWRLPDWLTEWMTGRLTGCLTDLLAGWLNLLADFLTDNLSPAGTTKVLEPCSDNV